MEQNRPRRWFRLIPFLALCAGAAAMGELFPRGAWYESLRKPEITPDGWVFGAVWTPLYVMIAVAGWLLWEQCRSCGATRLWFLQLALNALWTPLFFGLRRPGVALIDIMLLWIAIVATVISSWRVQRTAAWLLAPYLAWVTFATLLNAGFWLLNRGG
jgi:tryptophan-rich sensory protein